MTDLTVNDVGIGLQRITLQKRDCPQIVAISIRSGTQSTFTELTTTSDGTCTFVQQNLYVFYARASYTSHK